MSPTRSNDKLIVSARSSFYPELKNLVEELKRVGDAEKPIGRTADLVVQELNGEMLIYDLRDHRAFCLNETAATVWKQCSGSRTVGEIGRQIGNEDLVWIAIDQLKQERLLDAAPEMPGHFGKMTRREAIRRAALASAVALPIIASIVAPTAASAQSCRPNDSVCTASSECCSSCCKNVGGGVNQCKPGGGACLP